MSGYSIRSSYIAKFQREGGLDLVGVTSAQHPFEGTTDELIDEVPFMRTAAPRGPLYPGLRELRLMRALQKNVRRAIKRWKPDIVHAHSPMLVGLPALLEARRSRLPFVYEVRDLWENASVDRGKFSYDSPQYRAAHGLESIVFRSADAVVTICEGLRKALAPRVGRNTALHVVANGVDTNRFVPLAPQEQVRDRWNLRGKRLVTYLGSFQPYEGLATLIDAVPRLCARMPDAHVVIIGGQSDALEQQVAALGVTDHVTFTGRVPHDEVEGLYSIADLMVYPRTRTRTTEITTPLKPLEAMAMARPALISDVGAMLELVRHDETGVIFRAGDADDLADKALSVLSDPTRAKKLGEAGREWVLSERHWPTLISSYQDIYRQAQENRS